jgi:hypothetical protein
VGFLLALLFAAVVPGGWMALPLFGAVTVAQVSRDNNGAAFSVIATADGDVAATVTHGLGQVPRRVTLTPMLTLALTALPMWTVNVIGVTTVTLIKLASAGSGNAAEQLRVQVDL